MNPTVDSIPDTADEVTAPALREMPQVARDFLAHLRRRSAIDMEPMSGGSYRDAHLAQTGHELERGCCTLAVNRCAGCREVLPRAAKVKGEKYCSRECREAATTS